MSHRADFLKVVTAQIDKPVVWAQRGPDAFDCSGLVTWAMKRAGGPDLTQTDNAQMLHDKTRELGASQTEQPLPGDLAFYGVYEKMADLSELKVHIVHVAVVDEFGGVISADGATPSVRSIAQAMANPHNRVRRHTIIRYRKDTPVIVVCRNTLIDALDQVTR